MSFRAYGRYTGLRETVVYGGVSQHPQVQALRRGVDILVATPGRLLDLMSQGHVDLSSVETLVLDEADQMLDMGFIRDLKRIVARVPSQRQTLLFSATMRREIRQLADEWLHDPVAVSVAPQGTPVERIEQSVYFLHQRAKPNFLAQYVRGQATRRALVFTKTKRAADMLVRSLRQAGIRAEAIHGSKSQSVRQQALIRFKSEQPPVLVATDIAARGLDITGVSHVINFDLPMTPELYVHRIGRTARAGAEGIAVTFCDPAERSMLRQIERLTRQRLNVAENEFAESGQVTPHANSRPMDSGAQRAHSRNGRPFRKETRRFGRHSSRI
jgi:ATP-dependent RNA helicase RhlE